MNEELQKQLAESIKSFANSVGTAKDFAVEQAPDVIQQYLLWGIVGNAGGTIISLIVIWLCYMAVFKWSDQTRSYGSGLSESKFIASVLGGAITAFSVTAFFLFLFSLLKIIIAPKIYLIEAASKLIN